MIINGVYVLTTNEILYSRSQRDFRTSSDGLVAVDGGFSDEGYRIQGNPKNYVHVLIDGDKLLKFILGMDYMNGNKNAEEFMDGYHGRFQVRKNSNPLFYSDILINWKDVEDIIIKVSKG